MDQELRLLEREALLSGTGRASRGARLRGGLSDGGGPARSLRDFIRAEANAHALELAIEVAERRAPAHVFLDGPTGTGKTLLLRALHAARADSALWTGVDLHERAAAAVEDARPLDVPRLLLVDDLTRFPAALGALLALSLRGTTLVAAGAAVRDACAALGGRLAVVGPLDERGRAALFARALGRLGARADAPDLLPASGFEIEGLARNLALRAAT